MENTNEQWLLDGNCIICRRANYCSKDCKAHKNHLNEIIQKAFEDVMEERAPGYKNLMDKIKLN